MNNREMYWPASYPTTDAARGWVIDDRVREKCEPGLLALLDEANRRAEKNRQAQEQATPATESPKARAKAEADRLGRALQRRQGEQLEAEMRRYSLEHPRPQPKTPAPVERPAAKSPFLSIPKSMRRILRAQGIDETNYEQYLRPAAERPKPGGAFGALSPRSQRLLRAGGINETNYDACLANGSPAPAPRPDPPDIEILKCAAPSGDCRIRTTY